MHIPELENADKPTRRMWTQEEEDVLREYYQPPKSVTINALMEYLNRTRTSIVKKVAQLGLSRRG
jgi:hypothetical protein